MPNFRAAEQAARKPKRLVVLSPDAFADDWKEKPESETALGLRFVSAADSDIAGVEALERATQWATNEGRADKEHFDAVYNDQLIYGIVARATTDANDVTQAFFQTPVEDTARDALTPQGARRIWDELQALHVGSGVALPVAGDDDVKRLAAILARGTAMQVATPAQSLEARKFVSYLLEQLGPLDPSATAEDAEAIDLDEPEEDDEDGYLVSVP